MPVPTFTLRFRSAFLVLIIPSALLPSDEGWTSFTATWRMLEPRIAVFALGLAIYETLGAKMIVSADSLLYRTPLRRPETSL